MNIPDAVHCSGCGEVLGLEPAGDPDYLKCPRCSVDLEVFRGATGRLRDCGRCGGQFVEHALLRDLIERREIYGTVAPRLPKKANPLLDPVHYVPCPECRTMMMRRNFGGASGVIVDVCAPHGIWFDAGELPVVLEFVECGGLAASRRREMEEAERRKRAAVTTLPFSAPPVVGAAPHTFVDATRWVGGDMAADAVTSLLEYVASLLPDARG